MSLIYRTCTLSHNKREEKKTKGPTINCISCVYSVVLLIRETDFHNISRLYYLHE
jgi:hypothetical protein